MAWKESVLAQVAVRARERGLLKEEDFETLAREAAGSDAAAEAPWMTRYEIREALGEGAAATVYRARDRELGRAVALKVLRESMSVSESLRHRFHREAQVMAGIAHPNVVAVYDAGEADSRMYLAMELVEGRSLAKVLSERRFELRPMLELLAKAARGVGAAHEKGIVHRDLKPANILVAKDNEPKVADFGLAHLVGSETGLTKTGSTLGTPLYMAPEQVRGEGKELTPRTDVYALGAILYEILTGRPPFVAGTVVELYSKILIEEPLAPRKVNPKLSRELETICLKALEKEPLKRYANAKAFAEDLRRHLEGEPILARPSSPVTKATKWVRRHRATSAVGGVVLASVLVVAGVIAGNAAAQAREKQAAVVRFLQEGRKARADHEALQKELAGLREEEKSLSATVEPHEGGAKKQPLWDAQKKVQEKDEETAVRYTDIIVAFTSCLGVDPQNREAKGSLVGLYFAEFERSEKENDRRGVKVNEKMVRLFDDGTYAPKLVREGTIALDSNPTGAEVYVFRYEEGRDRRLMPRPYSLSRGESRAPVVERNAETEYALEFSEFNRLGTCPIGETKLAGGSYLLVLRKEGYRDVRYPVYIERGTRHVGKVNLYTEEEIGKDFVYVPGGTFIMGGDKEAYVAGLREEKSVEDFFIGKYEVTWEEYGEFLNDRGFHDVEKAWERAPRQAPRSGQYGRRSADGIVLAEGQEQWPVLGISWDDARAYCDWMTRKAKQRGEGVTYRLPESVEWEKAARGADARGFPWGNALDWSFTSGGESKSGRRQPDRIGEFAKDESPYGIRDMGGSMREWCGDWEDERKGNARVRGGSWGDPVVTNFRTASRYWFDRTIVDTDFGFRLARVPGLR